VETFPEKYSPKRKVSTVVTTDEFYKFVNVTIPKGSNAGSAKESTAKSQASSNKKVLLFFVLILVGVGAYFNRDKLPAWYAAFVEKLSAATTSSGRSHHKGDGDGSSNTRSGSGEDSGLLRKRPSKKPKLVS